MKVLILCGGRGILDPDTRQRIPKALLRVGDRPLVWHIMKTFALAGHTDFVLALGEGGEFVRRFFLQEHLERRDIEVRLGTGSARPLAPSEEDDWTVKCVDTGPSAQTGSRIARCRPHLDGEAFFTTYGDCLGNVDLAAVLAEHRRGDRLITVAGVQPASRFGAFTVSDGAVRGYVPETRLTGIDGYLNGGYMAMSPSVFDHLDVRSECNLERDVLPGLAAAGRIGLYPHHGYWQAVDTERDLESVARLHLENRRPWLSLGA